MAELLTKELEGRGGVDEGAFVVNEPCVLATQCVSHHFWVAPYECVVVACWVSWAAADATETFMLEKLTSGEAAEAGDDLFTGAVSLAGTANTPVQGTMIENIATRTLAAGDRLGAVFSAGIDTADPVCISVLIAPTKPKNYRRFAS